MTTVAEAYELVRKSQVTYDTLKSEQTKLQLEITAATSRLAALNQQLGQASVDLAQAKAALKQLL